MAYKLPSVSIHSIIQNFYFLLLTREKLIGSVPVYINDETDQKFHNLDSKKTNCLPVEQSDKQLVDLF